MNHGRANGALLPRTLLLAAGAIVSLAVLAWSLAERSAPAVEAGAEAAAAESSDDPTVLDSEGRFTGPGEVWPPQPKGATDVVSRDVGDLDATPVARQLAEVDRSSRLDRAPSVVVATDPAAQRALGETHNLIAVEDHAGRTRLVYYSLSTNQTVDLVVADGAIASIEVHRPDVFQPELSNDEKAAAVEVARAHWQTKGDRRIDSLQGFSILAFEPDGSYYDTRMVYVSFHIDEDSRPELLAWVDLARGQVVKSEVDR